MTQVAHGRVLTWLGILLIATTVLLMAFWQYLLAVLSLVAAVWVLRQAAGRA